MYAITKCGLLYDRDEYGCPIDDPNRNGDTSHLITSSDNLDPDADIPRTCETLWVTDSSTDDYHDIMNSSMFTQWDRNCLLPSFKRQLSR